MKRPVLSRSHARALVEVLRALEPDYRVGMRWSVQLYHALFGVPALLADGRVSRRPRPSLDAAHEAAEAFLSARRAGIYLARIPQEALQGLINGLESELTSARRRRSDIADHPPPAR